jgi:hypothetical protein
MAARVELDKDKTVEVSCAKMKDSKEFEALRFRLATSNECASCYLEPFSAEMRYSSLRTGAEGRAEQAANIALQLLPEDGIDPDDWIEATKSALQNAGLGASASSISRAHKVLVGNSVVVLRSGRYVRAGQVV